MLLWVKRLDSSCHWTPLKLNEICEFDTFKRKKNLSAHLFTSVGLFEGEPEGATVGTIGLMG